MSIASPSIPASSQASVAPELDDVLETIAHLARTELEVSKDIGLETDLAAELALDSLGLTVLAVGLENRFRIRLQEEDASGIRTVRDLAELVLRRVAEQRS